jgi:hypothetical protein
MVYLIGLILNMVLAIIVVLATSREMSGDLFNGWELNFMLILGLTASYVLAGATVPVALLVAVSSTVVIEITEAIYRYRNKYL